MRRHFAALIILLSFAIGTSLAQREWQDLAAANLKSVERGTAEYLLAMLERTSAMLNHDKEQAIEFAEQALTEAKRQADAHAEAICYLQRSSQR